MADNRVKPRWLACGSFATQPNPSRTSFANPSIMLSITHTKQSDVNCIKISGTE